MSSSILMNDWWLGVPRWFQDRGWSSEKQRHDYEGYNFQLAAPPPISRLEIVNPKDQGFHQSWLHNKTSTKTLNNSLESFWVGEHIQVPGGWHTQDDTTQNNPRTEVPVFKILPYLALRISSIWNKPVIVSKVFPWILWVIKANYRIAIIVKYQISGRGVEKPQFVAKYHRSCR